MAQYHGFSREEKPTDVIGRIEHGLQWCLRHWRSLAALVGVLLVVLAGFLWNQQTQQQHAVAASAQLANAKDDPALLEPIAQNYATTVAGQEARFRLARRAFDAKEYGKAREWLTPVGDHATFPIFQAAALMWIATSHEAEAHWGEAADGYRRVLALKESGIDHDRALRNLVRCLKRAGKTTEIHELLQTTSLTATKEVEELWLAIDHVAPPASQP